MGWRRVGWTVRKPRKMEEGGMEEEGMEGGKTKTDERGLDAGGFGCWEGCKSRSRMGWVGGNVRGLLGLTSSDEIKRRDEPELWKLWKMEK